MWFITAAQRIVRRAAMSAIARRKGMEIDGTVNLSLRGTALIAGDARVSFGDGTWILRGYRIAAAHASEIRVGAGTQLGEGAILDCMPGAKIAFGMNCWVNHGLEIVARQQVSIGSDSRIGPQVLIIDHDHEMKRHQRIVDQGYVTASVRVGNDCWIGARAILLKGASMGDAAVLGAGSVLRAHVPPGEIWAGVPARKIGERQ